MDQGVGLQKIIGNYTLFLDEPLGQGAFGQVYKAAHRDDTNTYLAAKVMSRSNFQIQKGDSQQERMYQKQVNEYLKQQIKAISMVKHENLVGLVAIQNSVNNMYIIMQLCDGGTLEDRIQNAQGRRLSEDQAVRIMRCLIDAIYYMHSIQLFHRDLKPANIIFKGNTPQITDYGFAQYSCDLDQVRMQSRIGSPLWMSPQILSSEQYSAKTDIWSLGFIFYQILYGKEPFYGNSQKALLDTIRNELLDKNNNKVSLKFPSTPFVTPIVQDLVARMLVYHEKDRISFDELNGHPAIRKMTSKFVQNLVFDGKGDPFLHKSIIQYKQRVTKQGTVFDNALPLPPQELNDNAKEKQPTFNNFIQEQTSLADITMDQDIPKLKLQEPNQEDQIKIQKRKIFTAENQKRVFAINNMNRAILFFRNRAYISFLSLTNFYAVHQKFALPAYFQNSLLFCLGFYNLGGLKITIELLSERSVLFKDHADQMAIYLNSEIRKITLQETEEKLADAQSLIENFNEPVSSDLKRVQKSKEYLGKEDEEVVKFIQDLILNETDFVELSVLREEVLQKQIAILCKNCKETRAIASLILITDIDKFITKTNYYEFDYDEFCDDFFFKKSIEELQKIILEFLVLNKINYLM